MWKVIGIGCGVLLALGASWSRRSSSCRGSLMSPSSKWPRSRSGRRSPPGGCPGPGCGTGRGVPGRCRGYQLDRADDRAAVAEFGLDAKGAHGVYLRPEPGRGLRLPGVEAGGRGRDEPGRAGLRESTGQRHRSRGRRATGSPTPPPCLPPVGSVPPVAPRGGCWSSAPRTPRIGRGSSTTSCRCRRPGEGPTARGVVRSGLGCALDRPTLNPSEPVAAADRGLDGE